MSIGNTADSKGDKMKVFVTGVCGQLGHDVVNELARRGYQSVGSDIQKVYSGVADESAVTFSKVRKSH